MVREPDGRFPTLEGLAERFALSPEQIAALRGYGDALAHDPLAPTAVRDPAAVVADHLADALVALELPVFGRSACEQQPGGSASGGSARLLADIGAGAGVPGIPLAIAMPDARVLLVEGNGRKCSFMRAVLGSLGAGNAEVVHGRAETWVEGRGRMDIVTARALAPLDVVAEYAAPLLKLGGALIAWRGAHNAAEEEAAARAATILGLEVLAPVRVVPYPGALNRHMHVLVKREPTPERFPRRDGVARKRPLGGARA